ncbi:MAG TPA: endonuclease/exonuclease/phosphatase family protein [Herpetosiphonaceae bacterium]|nr:endonuclease/exonuclease/phosphatase family protein [Herpetosiphonaceae bacterium]
MTQSQPATGHRPPTTGHRPGRSRRLGLIAAGLVLIEPALQLTPLAATAPLKLALAVEIWLFAIPALALAAGLIRRRRAEGVVGGLGLLLFAALYGGHFRPRQAEPAGQTLRVMTWNLRYDETDARAIAAAVQREQPDVLAVQELGAALDGPLAALLNAAYPHQARYPDPGHHGFAVYSRLPVRSEPPALGMDDCRCQVATLSVAGRGVTLINAHPHTARRVKLLGLPVGIDTGSQDGSFRALAALVGRTAGPLILAGDLNTTERQPNYRLLRRSLGDAFAERGWGLGLTYPSEPKLGPLPWGPILRLDYILPSADWRSRRAWSGAVAGVSDHGFVVADLELDSEVRSQESEVRKDLAKSTPMNDR